jgi:hypothetical protein
MEATMKKKIVTEDDEEVERFGKRIRKPQSDFMKQLTDIASQVVEPPPPPTPPTQKESAPPTIGATTAAIEEIKRQVNLILYLIISIRFISLSRKRKYLELHLRQVPEQLVQLLCDVHQK